MAKGQTGSVSNRPGPDLYFEWQRWNLISSQALDFTLLVSMMPRGSARVEVLEHVAAINKVIEEKRKEADERYRDHQQDLT